MGPFIAIGLCMLVFILSIAFLATPNHSETSTMYIQLVKYADHACRMGICRSTPSGIERIDFLPGGNATQIRGPALPPFEIRCQNAGAIGGELAFACHAVSDTVVLTEVHMKCDPTFVFGKNMRSPCHVFYAAESATRAPVRGNGVRAIPVMAPKENDSSGWMHLHNLCGIAMLCALAYLMSRSHHASLEDLRRENEWLARRVNERAKASDEARALFPFLWLDSPLELDDARAQWRVVMDAHRVGPKTRLWPAVLDCARAQIGAIATDA